MRHTMLTPRPPGAERVLSPSPNRTGGAGRKAPNVVIGKLQKTALQSGDLFPFIRRQTTAADILTRTPTGNVSCPVRAGEVPSPIRLTIDVGTFPDAPIP